MAKTVAERQKEYRTQRQFVGKDGNGERRMSAYVSTHAALALNRLAKSYGITNGKYLSVYWWLKKKSICKRSAATWQNGKSGSVKIVTA